MEETAEAEKALAELSFQRVDHAAFLARRQRVPPFLRVDETAAQVQLS